MLHAARENRVSSKINRLNGHKLTQSGDQPFNQIRSIEICSLRRVLIVCLPILPKTALLSMRVSLTSVQKLVHTGCVRQRMASETWLGRTFEKIPMLPECRQCWRSFPMSVAEFSAKEPISPKNPADSRRNSACGTFCQYPGSCCWSGPWIYRMRRDRAWLCRCARHCVQQDTLHHAGQGSAASLP
mgnify:CR=1 FL=1